MTTLGSPVYGGNSNTPLWLSASPTSISLAGTAPLVLTNIGGVLAQNGVISAPTAQWSLYPATSNTIKMDASNTITNSGANLYYNGNLIANASDISNIADWALYNASADVNLSNAGSNNSIVGARNITAISNISGGTLSGGTLTSSAGVNGTIGTFTSQVVTPVVISASNLSVSATSNLTQFCGVRLSNNAPVVSNSFNTRYNILGDRGIDYTDYCITNLSNKGGKGGQINLTADAGSVEISGVTYGIGGVINLTANSPLTVPYTLTSAIKLSAASILSYAGAVSPVGSLAGYNYIQGTLGVNIVAGTASSVPNTVGTIYLYGAQGTKIQNSLYVDQIINYPGSNLNIHPDSSQWTDMTRVQLISMGNNPVIDGGSNGVISNFSAVVAGAFNGTSYFASTGGTFPAISGNSISTINVPFVAGSHLTLTAQQFVGAFATSNYNINLNASCNININPSNGGQVYINGQIQAPSISSSSNFSITATSNLTFTAGSNLNLVGSVRVNGNPINTTSSNWSTFPATQSVDMSNYAISNAGIITGTGGIDIRSLNASNGTILITAGASYHRMALQTGSALNISSSNTIELQGQALSILSPVNAGNNTISNIGSLVMSSGNLNMNGNVISNVAAISSATGLQLNSPPGVTINAPLSMGSYGITNCSSISNTTGITINPGAGYPLNINSPITLNNNVISNAAGLTSFGGISIVANSNNATPGTGFFMTVGSTSVPYHQISAQQGQGFFLGSSNFISIGGTTTYLTSPAVAQNTFSRQLSASNVAQPIIQYGTGVFTGASGTLVITIPTSYTGSGTYVVQLTMRDSAATVYALPNTGSTFTITWTGGSGGTQNVMWTTFGT